jgi:hypothetical protein
MQGRFGLYGFRLGLAIALSAAPGCPAWIDRDASAQSSATGVAVDERASELRAFRDRLRSNDEIDRAAAFEIGLASSDPVARQMTLKEAVRSKYKDLQAFALRGWISSHSKIIVQLSYPDRPNEATVKMHEVYLGDGMILEDISVTPNGEIMVRHIRSGTSFTGQFTPGGLLLVANKAGVAQSCQINLSVVDDTLLSGALRCSKLDPIVAKAQID